MNENLLSILIVGLVVAFVVYRVSRQPLDQPPDQLPDLPTSQDSHESSLPAPLSEDELLAREAAGVQARWAQELRAIEQAHDNAMLPLMKKLKQARQLVTKSGVGNAACDVLRFMWHGPSWLTRDDGSRLMPLEGWVSGDLDGGERGKWLGWIWEDASFRLELIVRSSFFPPEDGSTLGDLKLTVDDEQVMHLDVSQRLGDEYDSWRVSGVSAFKAGPWMAQLNELAGRLQIAKSQQLRDLEKSFYSKRAGNIELE